MCATQWTIYMSLVTQGADPGDRLGRVIIPPPLASSINDTSVIYYPSARAEHCFWPLHPNNFQGKLLPYTHHSGKMLNKIPTDTLITYF